VSRIAVCPYRCRNSDNWKRYSERRRRRRRLLCRGCGWKRNLHATTGDERKHDIFNIVTDSKGR
jgi:hypothetical protein